MTTSPTSDPLPDSAPVPFPTQGRLLGCDYGTKRLGLAISNPEQTIASPFENCPRADKVQELRHLRQVVQDYRVVGLIVGLPVHLSGDEGGKAREARAFGDGLSQTLSLPVRYWDERYSSAIAEAHLISFDMSRKKRKARLDKLAAQVILQSYLDSGDRAAVAGPLG